MKKVNLTDIADRAFRSPKGKFSSSEREISRALGRDEEAPSWKDRHPFDVALVRISPGGMPWPYHAETAQWEFYTVVSGRAQVRDEAGTTEVAAGDSFIFRPGEAHQFLNHGTEDFVYYVIADNPVGDSCYYPDSRKWGVRMAGKSKILREDVTDYFEGEE